VVSTCMQAESARFASSWPMTNLWGERGVVVSTCMQAVRFGSSIGRGRTCGEGAL
jgi:hypothetical protein